MNLFLLLIQGPAGQVKHFIVLFYKRHHVMIVSSEIFCIIRWNFKLELFFQWLFSYINLDISIRIFRCIDRNILYIIVSLFYVTLLNSENVVKFCDIFFHSFEFLLLPLCDLAPKVRDILYQFLNDQSSLYFLNTTNNICLMIY